MGWDFNLNSAMAAMVKTAPFIVLRMLVYFGIALLYVFAVGTGGAIGYGFTSFSGGEGSGSLYGGIIGFAGASGILYWIREYILYIVKAGHIAVLTRYYDGQDFPGGQGQVSYASDVVKERFAEASTLFALDQLIKGVVKFITGTLSTVAAFLPIPGLQHLVGIANGVIRMSLTYVDELILAHNIRIGSTNPWETSCDALVLYAQNIRTMIRNAVWLSLMMWALTLVIFIVLLGPVFAIMAIFPGNIGFVAFIITFIFAWAFKAALIEPIAIFALMQVYFKTIEGQVPDEEWRAKLEGASKKFREMKDKAMAYVPGHNDAGGEARGSG
ncbi:MAG: hypothetical protein ABJN26_14325 [Stappiaceae bacterium]